jgi:tetratricopeptide (TPR) repeat protein
MKPRRHYRSLPARSTISGLMRTSFWPVAALIAVNSIFVLFVGTAVLGQNGVEDIHQESLPLDAGTPTERGLAAQDRHYYHIALIAGQCANIVLDPQGIDLTVVLFRNDGTEVFKMESPYGAQEPISVSLVAKKSDGYTLGVRASEEGAQNGYYKIELREIRAATQQDESLAEAQKIFATGQVQHKKRTAESQQSALAQFGQAYLLFQKAGYREGEAQTLDQLGGLHDEIGDNHNAVDEMQRALSIFREVDDRRGEAMALNDLGSAYNNLGENQKSLELLNQALAIRREIVDRRGEGETLEHIADVYENLSENTKALEFYNAALATKKAINDRRGEAESLDDIGQVYYDIDQDQKALDYYNQALVLQNELQDAWGKAISFNNIAVAYDTMGDKERSLDFYGKSLPLKRATGNRRGEATTLNNMCWLEFTLGYWQSAFDNCNSSLAIQRAITDRQGQTRTLSYIASLYNVLGEKQRALNYFQNAVTLARATGNRLWESITLNNMGLVFYELEDNQKALTYYDQALSLKRAIGDREGEAATLNNIGRAQDALGDKTKALEYFSQAVGVAHNANSRHWEATVLGNTGWLYAAKGENQKALDYFNQALPLHRSLSDLRAEASISYGIARAEKGLGDLPAAMAQIEAALKIIESLRTKITSQQLRASYFSSVREYYDFYIDLLMQLDRLHPSEGYDARAFAANERSKARSLLESLGEARAEIREGADQQLLERQRSLQQLLDGKTEHQMSVLADKHTEEQAAELKKDIEEILTEYGSVEDEIRAKSPRYAALTQPDLLTVTRVQKEVLDSDTVLLEYNLGEQRSYLWALTPTSFQSFELPSRADIEAATRSVYECPKTTRNDPKTIGRQCRGEN